jgi:hypothetical protein
MASTSELLSAGIFVLVNTFALAAFTLMGGPIFGYLTSFSSSYNYTSAPVIPVTVVQWIPGFFFMMLLVLEIVLIIRLAYVVVSKTDYQGETEW